MDLDLKNFDAEELRDLRDWAQAALDGRATHVGWSHAELTEVLAAVSAAETERAARIEAELEADFTVWPTPRNAARLYQHRQMLKKKGPA